MSFWKDDDAWVRELWPRVYALAYRMLRNAPDAQDAAQEAFVRALDRWETWLGEGPRERWVLRIATRVCLDALERRKRMGRGQAEVGNLPAKPVEAAPEPVRDRLLECLDELPPQQRAAFVLRDMQGLAFQAVADALGCSGTTARVHLMKARLGLREIWIRKFGERP